MSPEKTSNAQRMLDCAVATPHTLATEAAIDTVRHGGNAVDAALTAAFVLTVVYPHNTALGGDVIALVRQKDGTITCVNSSGPASRNVSLAAYRERYGETMPVTGVDTITVPGAVAGLGAVHELGASRPWADQLTVAHKLAKNGTPVAPSLDAAIKENLALVLGDPGLLAVFAPNGSPLNTGDAMVQPALANSFRELADHGPSVFYEGELGRTLIAALQKLGSQLDVTDFARFQPHFEEPLHGKFRQWDVWTSGPNSQGFLLLEILGALEALNPSRDPLGNDAGVLSELFLTCAADREAFLADPDAMTVSTADLLSGERLAKIARDAVEKSRLPESFSRVSMGRAKGDTVAIVTADDEGRAVCLIQSLFHSFGAGILEPSTGIVMHNRGSFFSLSPTSANQLAPARRPAHTLMPVMITKGENLAWVMGTMGGKAQPQILTQVLLRLVAGETPHDAVAAPRWVVGGIEVDKIDETASVELSISAQALRSIKARLPVVELSHHDEATGHAQVVAVDASGSLVAASDPRSDGHSDSSKVTPRL